MNVETHIWDIVLKKNLTDIYEVSIKIIIANILFCFTLIPQP